MPHYPHAIPILIIAVGLVLAIAYTQRLRARTLWFAAFFAAVLSSAALFASPPYPGYADDQHPTHVTYVRALAGPRLAGILAAVAMTCTLCAFGFRRPEHHEEL